jgi:polar amino acid transport system substrate-binding protein
MLFKRFFTLSSIIALLICFQATSAMSQILKIGYVEFPPMTYTDQNGQPSGFIIDIGIKTLEKAGFEWSAISLPANRLANLLAAGDIHVWLGLDTLPQLKNTTLVSKAVIAHLILRAYTIGNKPPITNKEDLKGKTLLILRGYSYGGWVTFIKNPANNIKYLEFDTHEKAFHRLEKLSKRIQDIYLLDYKHPSDAVLQKQNIPGIQYSQIVSLDMHFIISKKLNGAQGILKRIEAAYQQLLQSGAL